MKVHFVNILLILPLAVADFSHLKYRTEDALLTSADEAASEAKLNRKTSYSALKGEDFDAYFRQLVKRDLQMSMKETKEPKPTKAPTTKETKAPTVKETKAPTVKETKAPTQTKNPKLEDSMAPSIAPVFVPTVGPSVAPAPPSGPMLLPVVLINAGNVSETYTDGIGDIWEVDNYFDSGITRERIREYDETDDDPLYYQDRTQTGQRPLIYEIPVEDGMYIVQLHFTEQRGGRYETGARVFNVSMEGEVVLEDYDIYNTTGDRFVAVVETFMTAVDDGALTIEFTASVDQGKVNAIGVYKPSLGVDPDSAPPSDAPSLLPSSSPTAPSPPTPSMLVPIVQINAGNTSAEAYVARDGTTWQPDAFFNDGSRFLRRARVYENSGGDNVLYHEDRFAIGATPILTYDIPIDNGMYIVQLHFVEQRNNRFEVGARVFNVSVEGSVVLEDYDIFAATGAGLTAVVETVMATVVDSSLTIDFVASVDVGKINAIGVYGMSPI